MRQSSSVWFQCAALDSAIHSTAVASRGEVDDANAGTGGRRVPAC
ncbi:MAG: hypothetical protein U1F67_22905 [Rubrivivax sp.]